MTPIKDHLCYDGWNMPEAVNLCMLPGIGPQHERRIKNFFHVDNVNGMVNISMAKLKRCLGSKRGESVFYHIQAYMRMSPLPAEGKQFHLERGAGVIHFDFESANQKTRGMVDHVYLIGMLDEGLGRTQQLLARGEKEERKIFEEFLAIAGKEEIKVLYHWSTYETIVMKGIAKKYPELSDGLLKLSHKCVDLKDAIKDQVFLPVPDYSLKNVAPALGFFWRHPNFGAFDAMMAYWRYAKGDNGASTRKFLDYNEDDVLAMAFVSDKLTQWLG